MIKLTLWESLCKLSGSDKTGVISVQEALEHSAVSRGIADVEIQRLIAEGMLFDAGNDQVQLTEEGRKACVDLHQSHEVTGL